MTSLCLLKQQIKSQQQHIHPNSNQNQKDDKQFTSITSTKNSNNAQKPNAMDLQIHQKQVIDKPRSISYNQSNKNKTKIKNGVDSEEEIGGEITQQSFYKQPKRNRRQTCMMTGEEFEARKLQVTDLDDIQKMEILKRLCNQKAVKTDKDNQLIYDILKDNQYVKYLKEVKGDSFILSKLCPNIRILMKHEGELIYEQDSLSQGFYVVIKGECEGRMKNTQTGQYRQINDKYIEGTEFGNIEMLDQKTRMQTLFSKKESWLMHFDTNIQRQHFSGIQRSQLEYLMDLLNIFPCFQSYGRRNLLNFLPFFTFQSYIRNQKVYSFSNQTDYIYFIINGDFKVYQKVFINSDMTLDQLLKIPSRLITEEKDKYIRTIEVSVLNSGSIFGEEEIILEEDIRKQEVICTSLTGSVLLLHKEDYAFKFSNDQYFSEVFKNLVASKRSYRDTRLKEIENKDKILIEIQLEKKLNQNQKIEYSTFKKKESSNKSLKHNTHKTKSQNKLQVFLQECSNNIYKNQSKINSLSPVNFKKQQDIYNWNFNSLIFQLFKNIFVCILKQKEKCKNYQQFNVHSQNNYNYLKIKIPNQNKINLHLNYYQKKSLISNSEIKFLQSIFTKQKKQIDNLNEFLDNNLYLQVQRNNNNQSPTEREISDNTGNSRQFKGKDYSQQPSLVETKIKEYSLKNISENYDESSNFGLKSMRNGKEMIPPSLIIKSMDNKSCQMQIIPESNKSKNNQSCIQDTSKSPSFSNTYYKNHTIESGGEELPENKNMGQSQKQMELVNMRRTKQKNTSDFYGTIDQNFTQRCETSPCRQRNQINQQYNTKETINELQKSTYVLSDRQRNAVYKKVRSKSNQADSTIDPLIVPGYRSLLKNTDDHPLEKQFQNLFYNNQINIYYENQYKQRHNSEEQVQFETFEDQEYQTNEEYRMINKFDNRSNSQSKNKLNTQQKNKDKNQYNPENNRYNLSQQEKIAQLSLIIRSPKDEPSKVYDPTGINKYLRKSFYNNKSKRRCQTDNQSEVNQEKQQQNFEKEPKSPSQGSDGSPEKKNASLEEKMLRQFRQDRQENYLKASFQQVMKVVNKKRLRVHLYKKNLIPELGEKQRYNQYIKPKGMKNDLLCYEFVNQRLNTQNNDEENYQKYAQMVSQEYQKYKQQNNQCSPRTESSLNNDQKYITSEQNLDQLNNDSFAPSNEQRQTNHQFFKSTNDIWTSLVGNDEIVQNNSQLHNVRGSSYSRKRKVLKIINDPEIKKVTVVNSFINKKDDLSIQSPKYQQNQEKQQQSNKNQSNSTSRHTTWQEEPYQLSELLKAKEFMPNCFIPHTQEIHFKRFQNNKGNSHKLNNSFDSKKLNIFNPNYTNLLLGEQLRLQSPPNRQKTFEK